jgi:hypothetical protein
MKIVWMGLISFQNCTSRKFSGAFVMRWFRAVGANQELAWCSTIMSRKKDE